MTNEQKLLCDMAKCIDFLMHEIRLRRPLNARESDEAGYLRDKLHVSVKNMSNPLEPCCPCRCSACMSCDGYTEDS